MKIALIVLIILNLRFLIKGYVYKISFTGALYMLATQNPFITDDEIQALGKKALDCGIEHTVEDLVKKFSFKS